MEERNSIYTKAFPFKLIILCTREIKITSTNNENILFRGDLTGELTETRADCIFYPWILSMQRCRILSTVILLGLRGISERLVTWILLNAYMHLC